MDPRLLDYYERELQHIREMGKEFADEYPKIAARLGMEGIDVADPYVERLVEAFAFLAARVQLKIDAQYPQFTQHLLEMVYPHFLAPLPSAAVVQLQPMLEDGSLAEGFVVRRGTVLRSRLGRGDVTACEYRTAHDVTLWPVEIAEAEYASYSRELAGAQERGIDGIKASLRIRLRATADLTFDKIALDDLPLFLRGVGEIPSRVYEQVLANALGVLIRPVGAPAGTFDVLPREAVRRVGFRDDQALLPFGARSFHGYRLLQEYFAFPERFLFFDVAGMGPALRRSKGREIDVHVLLDRVDAALLNAVDAENFAPYCVPVLNLFPMRADNIPLTPKRPEYHVLADRTRPMDFEIWSVTSVTGTGTAGEAPVEFRPFYSVKERGADTPAAAYFAIRREPRVISESQKQTGNRVAYVGSEVFVSLVDTEAAPYRPDLKQVSLDVLCTNRDLPLRLTVGQGRGDFQLQVSAKVAAVRCLAGPTAPRPSPTGGKAAWRLVSHLSRNYLSLTDDESGRGAAAMRELLSLYVGANDAAMLKQVEGLRSVASRPIVRRIPTPGPITFGRGLEVTVTFDEAAFRGTGIFLLGAVLEEFLARHVSLNAFTETVIASTERGEIMRWPVRVGANESL